MMIPCAAAFCVVFESGLPRQGFKKMHIGLLLQLETCSFLGMESGLTHIQVFLQLSDNVGMFYP